MTVASPFSDEPRQTPTELAIRFARRFADLRGHRIHTWVGVEMAFDETADGLGIWDLPAPCLQFYLLGMQISGGRELVVGTRQDDADFYLGIRDATVRVENWEGIFRYRAVDELPIGEIDGVTAFIDTEVRELAEVELVVAGRPVLLIAAESHGYVDERPLFGPFGDAVLAFTEPALADHQSWNPQRSTASLRAYRPPRTGPHGTA